MILKQRETRSVITFPCCPKEKMIVFGRSSIKGDVSIKCPHCGNYVRFDLEQMQGRIYHALKGATTK